jgi:pSer/pThr/pTyr-binding forkhead associated (FHA) protein
VPGTRLLAICTKCGSRNAIALDPILIIQSSKEKTQLPLKTGSHIIGRKTDNAAASIQVDDEYVSRKHATLHIEERDGKMYFSVEDLKSTNGTFDKNKKKIKPNLKYPFLPEDYFIIGLTKISIKP